jgi:hypothetical protein
MRRGIPLVVYLDEELWAWLQDMHDVEGYPKTALVRFALREYKEKLERKIKEEC